MVYSCHSLTESFIFFGKYGDFLAFCSTTWFNYSSSEMIYLVAIQWKLESSWRFTRSEYTCRKTTNCMEIYRLWGGHFCLMNVTQLSSTQWQTSSNRAIYFDGKLPFNLPCKLQTTFKFQFQYEKCKSLPSDGPLGNIPDKRWRQTWRWVSQIRRTWFIQEKERQLSPLYKKLNENFINCLEKWICPMMLLWTKKF